MKLLYLLIAGALFMLDSGAQEYHPGDEGSSVKFRIKNLGIAITGSFTGLEGKIQFDPANPETASISATVDANSINTGIDMRDDHLRREEYFDVGHFPKISFVSENIRGSGRSGNYRVTGLLTIKGISKEISFPFQVKPQDGGLLFTGSFKINRRDWKVGGNSITLSDDLTVELSVFAPPASNG